MGSWDETCALSNLPIPAGEEVVFLLLCCREPGNHYVLSVPVYGTYADYGRVTAAEGQEVETSLALSQTEKAFTSPLKDFSELQESLGTDGVPFGEVRLYRILVRKDVWEGMLSFSARNWEDYSIEYADMEKGALQLEEAILSVPPVGDPLRGATLSLVEAESHGYFEYGFTRPFDKEICVRDNKAVYLASIGSFLSKILQGVPGYEQYQTNPKLNSLLTSLARLRFVEFIMSQSRMTWSVPGGRYTGSQEENFDLTKKIHKMMGNLDTGEEKDY